MTPSDLARLESMSEAARYIAPWHMPDANAGRKHWRCTCGNRFATDYTRTASCCDGGICTEETE